MKRNHFSADLRFFLRGLFLLLLLLLFGLGLSQHGLYTLTESKQDSLLIEAKILANSTLQKSHLGLLWRRIERVIFAKKKEEQ